MNTNFQLYANCMSELKQRLTAIICIFTHFHNEKKQIPIGY